MSRALAPSGPLTAPPAPPAKRYGRLTVESHYTHRKMTGEDLRTFLDGEDVTRWTSEVDDREGYVVLVAIGTAPLAEWLAKGGYYVGDAHVRIDGRDVRIAPAGGRP